jgi:hypothetical protein
MKNEAIDLSIRSYLDLLSVQFHHTVHTHLQGHVWKTYSRSGEPRKRRGFANGNNLLPLPASLEGVVIISRPKYKNGTM